MAVNVHRWALNLLIITQSPALTAQEPQSDCVQQRGLKALLWRGPTLDRHQVENFQDKNRVLAA